MLEPRDDVYMSKLTITRVRDALKRSTHYTDYQLRKAFPEFINLYFECKREERLLELRVSIMKRYHEILNQTSPEPEVLNMKYSDESKLFYLLDVIRDVKRQQPDISFLEILTNALALETGSIEWLIPLLPDERLCELLSSYHDKIYEQQKRLKSQTQTPIPGD